MDVMTSVVPESVVLQTERARRWPEWLHCEQQVHVVGTVHKMCCKLDRSIYHGADGMSLNSNARILEVKYCWQ